MDMLKKRSTYSKSGGRQCDRWWIHSDSELCRCSDDEGDRIKDLWVVTDAVRSELRELDRLV